MRYMPVMWERKSSWQGISCIVFYHSVDLFYLPREPLHYSYKMDQAVCIKIQTGSLLTQLTSFCWRFQNSFPSQRYDQGEMRMPTIKSFFGMASSLFMRLVDFFFRKHNAETIWVLGTKHNQTSGSGFSGGTLH